MELVGNLRGRRVKEKLLMYYCLYFLMVKKDLNVFVGWVVKDKFIRKEKKGIIDEVRIL